MPQDYQKMIAKLDSLKVQHFYFPEKSTVPLKAVRGLDINSDVEELKEDLLKLEFPVLKVNQMEKFNTKQKMPLFQIHLENNTKAKEIFKLQTLNFNIICIQNCNRSS